MEALHNVLYSLHMIAMLAILVGPVGRSKRFARQLADATRSLHVGWPADPLAEVGPVIERPQGKLAWALTELEGEEQWLIEPAVSADDPSGQLWRPGIRVGVHGHRLDAQRPTGGEDPAGDLAPVRHQKSRDH